MSLLRASRLHAPKGASIACQRRFIAGAKAIENAGANKKKQWICLIPDKPGALETRLKVRPSHLAAVAKHVDSGLFQVAGGFLDEQPTERDPTPKMNESILLAQAHTKEEILEVLKKDIYTTSGVWDWDRLQIRPFRAAFIVPPE